MKKRIFPFLAFLLVGSLPLLGSAKVPDSVSPGESNRNLNRTYEQTLEILKSSGYVRGVNGLTIGYSKGDFELKPSQSLQILPVSNKTGGESETLATLTKGIGDKLVQLLKATELFSSVTYGNESTKADLRLEIYVREVAGKNCLWGIDLYDNKTNEKLLSGFDKDSTAARDFAYGIFIALAENPHPLAYFQDDIPKKAMLFIGRANPAFNQEYFSKLQRKSPRGY